MNVSTISGIEMLSLLKRNKERKRVEKDVQFTMIEHSGQKLFLDGEFSPPEDFVVIVRKNSDFIEGRGPMQFHKAFRSIENAIEYIMRQPGIYGSTQGVSNFAGVNIHGEPYCVSGFNGYDLKIVELE